MNIKYLGTLFAALILTSGLVTSCATTTPDGGEAEIEQPDAGIVEPDAGVVEPDADVVEPVEPAPAE